MVSRASLEKLEYVSFDSDAGGRPRFGGLAMRAWFFAGGR
jgi:hypothetical protein